VVLSDVKAIDHNTVVSVHRRFSHASEIMPSVRCGPAFYLAMTRMLPRISPPGEAVVWTFA
jgi:hypothetical protein